MTESKKTKQAKASPEKLEVEEKVKTVTAKAGKRSLKALKQVEDKEAKEARKEQPSSDDEAKKTKPTIKSARSKLERSSKRFRKASELVDKTKEYSLKEALDLALKTSSTKFDETVEMHINLGVDPKQADQNVRDTVVMPAGTGKTVKIAVFADVDLAKTAKQAGADKAGNEDLLTELEKNVIDFDVLITTPQMMSKLAKYARILGPRGLMPNPKSGTVTKDVASAVKQAKAGRVEYRVDSTGIVHLAIGKISFGADKLEQNAKAIAASLKAAKPASLKSNYVTSFHTRLLWGRA